MFTSCHLIVSSITCALPSTGAQGFCVSCRRLFVNLSLRLKVITNRSFCGTACTPRLRCWPWWWWCWWTQILTYCWCSLNLVVFCALCSRHCFSLLEILRPLWIAAATNLRCRNTRRFLGVWCDGRGVCWIRDKGCHCWVCVCVCVTVHLAAILAQIASVFARW